MDILKVKNNGQWIGIPAVQGPPGPMGPQGPKGDPAEIDIATDEMVLAIIDDYPYDEGDEGMVFVANFVNPQSGDPYYETEADATDIMTAFKTGKHCIIKFMDSETARSYSCYAISISVCAVEDPNEINPGGLIRLTETAGGYPVGGCITYSQAYIADNGKLGIPVYVD